MKWKLPFLAMLLITVGVTVITAQHEKIDVAASKRIGFARNEKAGSVVRSDMVQSSRIIWFGKMGRVRQFYP